MIDPIIHSTQGVAEDLMSDLKLLQNPNPQHQAAIIKSKIQTTYDRLNLIKAVIDGNNITKLFTEQENEAWLAWHAKHKQIFNQVSSYYQTHRPEVIPESLISKPDQLNDIQEISPQTPHAINDTIGEVPESQLETRELLPESLLNMDSERYIETHEIMQSSNLESIQDAESYSATTCLDS
jgi:hypothetical protein